MIDRATARAARRAYGSAAAARVAAIVFLALGASLLPPIASGSIFAMTVDEAYQETDGHRHTDFDANDPGISHADATYLKKLFELVDLAIVEKLQTWMWFQSEGRRGTSYKESRARVDRLIAEIAGLQVPARLAPVHRLMVEAVHEQRAFFDAWQRVFDAADRGEEDASAGADKGRLLDSSSQKLHAAYDQLMVLFPNAGRQNFLAFYDHLCVLDFK